MQMFKQASWFGILSAVVAFVLPFVFSRSLFYGAINGKYFFLLGAISIAGLWGSYLLFKNRLNLGYVSPQQAPLLWATGVFLIIQYLATFTGAYPAGSLFSDIIRSTGVFFLTYIAFFAVILSTLLTRRDWSLIRWSVALSAGLFSALSLIGVAGLGFTGRFLSINFEIQGLTIANTTFAGVYLLLAFILAIIELIKTKRGTLARKVLIALAVVIVLDPVFINWHNLASPLGEARASVATLILFLFYLVALYLVKKFAGVTKRRLLPVLPIAFGLAVVIAVGFLFTPNSFVQEKYIEVSSAARIISWESGWEGFKDRPILGWGPENFRFAFAQNFDNRLHLSENIGETWFDRAHNIVIDTLTTTGVLGLVSYLILIGAFILVIIRARRAEVISETESYIWYAVPIVHFLQLQTGFDTVATYGLLAFFLGYGLWLEKESGNESSLPLATDSINKIVAGILVILILAGGYYLIWEEYRGQRATLKVFTAANEVNRVNYIGQALGDEVSFEQYRLLFNSLTKGLFENINDLAPSERGNFTRAIASQLEIYDPYFADYLERVPNDYRMRMNYAYLLLLKTAFGDNRAEEAKMLIAESYELSPNNPLTYVLASLAELYSGNLPGAREKLAEGKALNPEIDFTKGVETYLEKQMTNFPNISILRLENL